MGYRKKNNQRAAQQRIVSRKKRNIKAIKRMNKAQTPGQALHEKMHGRTA